MAKTTPPDLRGTAYGFFNLVSGLAMLPASIIAGLLWDRFGAAFTFYAGAAFCVAAPAGSGWLLRRATNRYYIVIVNIYSWSKTL